MESYHLFGREYRKNEETMLFRLASATDLSISIVESGNARHWLCLIRRSEVALTLLSVKASVGANATIGNDGFFATGGALPGNERHCSRQ